MITPSLILLFDLQWQFPIQMAMQGRGINTDNTYLSRALDIIKLIMMYVHVLPAYI